MALNFHKNSCKLKTGMIAYQQIFKKENTMNWKSIEKMITIGSLAISPWALNASVCHVTQTRGVQINLITEENINTLKVTTLQRKLTNLSDLEKVLPGFIVYHFPVERLEDKEDDQYIADHLPSDAIRRQRELNRWVTISLDAIADNVRPRYGYDVESKDILHDILGALNAVNYDIQFVNRHGGQFEKTVFDNLINCCEHIPYGCFLSTEDKKVVAEAIITMIVTIPSLSEVWQKEVSACCLRIWNKLQNGTLWQRPSEKAIQECNVRILKNIKFLQKLIAQRDPQRRDEVRAVAHREDCLTVLKDILVDLFYLEDYECKITKRKKVKCVLKSLIDQPGLSDKEKDIFRRHVEMSMLFKDSSTPGNEN